MSRSLLSRKLFQRLEARLDTGQVGSGVMERLGLVDPWARVGHGGLEFIYLTLPPDEDEVGDEVRAVEVVRRARPARVRRKKQARRRLIEKIMPPQVGVEDAIGGNEIAASRTPSVMPVRMVKSAASRLAQKSSGSTRVDRPRSTSTAAARAHRQSSVRHALRALPAAWRRAGEISVSTKEEKGTATLRPGLASVRARYVAPQTSSRSLRPVLWTSPTLIQLAWGSEERGESQPGHTDPEVSPNQVVGSGRGLSSRASDFARATTDVPRAQGGQRPSRSVDPGAERRSLRGASGPAAVGEGMASAGEPTFVEAEAGWLQGGRAPGERPTASLASRLARAEAQSYEVGAERGLDATFGRAVVRQGPASRALARTMRSVAGRTSRPRTQRSAPLGRALPGVRRRPSSTSLVSYVDVQPWESTPAEAAENRLIESQRPSDTILPSRSTKGRASARAPMAIPAGLERSDPAQRVRSSVMRRAAPQVSVPLSSGDTDGALTRSSQTTAIPAASRPAAELDAPFSRRNVRVLDGRARPFASSSVERAVDGVQGRTADRLAGLASGALGPSVIERAAGSLFTGVLADPGRTAERVVSSPTSRALHRAQISMRSDGGTLRLSASKTAHVIRPRQWSGAPSMVPVQFAAEPAGPASEDILRANEESAAPRMRSARRGRATPQTVATGASASSRVVTNEQGASNERGESRTASSRSASENVANLSIGAAYRAGEVTPAAARAALRDVVGLYEHSMSPTGYVRDLPASRARVQLSPRTIEAAADVLQRAAGRGSMSARVVRSVRASLDRVARRAEGTVVASDGLWPVASPAEYVQARRERGVSLAERLVSGGRAQRDGGPQRSWRSIRGSQPAFVTLNPSVADTSATADGAALPEASDRGANARSRSRSVAERRDGVRERRADAASNRALSRAIHMGMRRAASRDVAEPLTDTRRRPTGRNRAMPSMAVLTPISENPVSSRSEESTAGPSIEGAPSRMSPRGPAATARAFSRATSAQIQRLEREFGILIDIQPRTGTTSAPSLRGAGRLDFELVAARFAEELQSRAVEEPSSGSPAARAGARAYGRSVSPAMGRAWPQTVGRSLRGILSPDGVLLVPGMPSAAEVERGAAEGGSVRVRSQSRTERRSRRPWSGSDRAPMGSVLAAARSVVGPSEAFSRQLGRRDLTPSTRSRRGPGVATTFILGSHEAEGGAGPAWAERQERGVIGSRRSILGERAALQGRHGMLNALARATTPQEFVDVVQRNQWSAKDISRAMPAPAAKLVNRVVSVARAAERESNAEPRHVMGLRMRGTGPAPEFVRSPAQASASAQRQFLTVSAGPASAPGMAPSKVTSLANRLLNLIHLAEVDKRTSEAQAQVRMSDSTPGEGAGSSSKAGGEKTPNLKALKRQIFDEVLKELEQAKLQSMEDPDGGSRWW